MKRFVVLATGLTTALFAATSSRAVERAYNLPPSQRLLEPGPGVGGPGPGVLAPMGGYPGDPSSGAYSAGGVPCQAMSRCGPDCSLGGGGAALCGGGGGAAPLSQIAFLGVEGGQVLWDISGQGLFDSAPLIMPGRQNFYQGAIYRLKLSGIPDRPGVELYPTLEVAPVTPRTDAFLAHAPIPIQFTEEDLDQVLSGNFVTKVIYLPDPEFQELALAGVAELVSTRLNPGEDPITEADRRGSILAILRVGNLDLQLTGQENLGARPGVTHAQFDGEHVPDMDLGPGSPMPPVPLEGEVPQGVPMDHPMDGQPFETPSNNSATSYEEPVYDEGEYEGEAYEPAPSNGAYQGETYEGQSSAPYDASGSCVGGGGYPMGMPTAAMGGQPMPPHMMPGASGPQWGMPITGTPIGLPGPPHIPLGHQAGLTQHIMKNRTKILLPPPVHKMKMTVRQRPGMNYPRPVNHVRVDETPRAGFRMFGGTVPPALPTAMQKLGARLRAVGDCEENCPTN